jgi:apolipoprotein N-acyltransferase
MGQALARQLSLASLTGLLYPICFPDFDFGPVAWVVLIPLHLALDGCSPQRAFRVGWLAGLIAFVGVMTWVVTAMHQYGQMPLVASYTAMVLLCVYLGLYVAVYAATLAWLGRKAGYAGLFAAPFVWIALELVRTYLFSGLPWALLGYSQYRWLSIIQFADHTGVYGVSFLVVLVNAALAEVSLWSIRQWRRHWRREPVTAPGGDSFPWLTPSTAALGVALALWYGHAELQNSHGFISNEAPAAFRTIHVGLVQPNIDQAQKWDASYRRETLDRYARLTARAAEGAALVVWPEAATPFLFEQEPDYRTEVARLVQGLGAPLLFGSPALRYHSDRRPYLLNSAYLLSKDGTILNRYDKQHLVPFGEYIPLRFLLFFLEKFVVGIGDFEAGTIPTVFQLPGKPEASSAKFGVVICYEVIFPDLVRQFAFNGAEFMVTITNDAWFGASAAPYQHFTMVVFRAVENRMAFARAANTGVSGLIDSQGRILLATPIFSEAAVKSDLPISRVPTFYTWYGDVFAFGCVIITALLLVAAWRRARREARVVGEQHA